MVAAPPTLLWEIDGLNIYRFTYNRPHTLQCVLQMFGGIVHECTE